MGGLTDAANNNIGKAKDFEDFLAMNQEDMLDATLSKYLMQLLKEMTLCTNGDSTRCFLVNPYFLTT